MIPLRQRIASRPYQGRHKALAEIHKELVDPEALRMALAARRTEPAYSPALAEENMHLLSEHFEGVSVRPARTACRR